MPISTVRSVAAPAEFEEVRWHSRALQRRAGFLLHLPCDYSERLGRRFPVLYFLHGSGHDLSSVVQQVCPQEQLDALGAALLVIPEGEQGWWLDSPVERRSRFGQYVLELVRLIEERYLTFPTRAGRGLCGFSMGGYGAMLLACQHPDLFGAASSLLGTLDIAQMFPDYHRLRLLLGADLEAWQEFNPTALVARLAHPVLYFCTARDAFDRPQNEAFAAALRSHGIAFESATHAGTHEVAWVRTHLRDALAFHRRAFDRVFQSGYNRATGSPALHSHSQE